MLVTVLLLPAIALAAPDFVVDFQPAVLQVSPAQSNESMADEGGLAELLKRQTGCATGYAACVNINQPGLCCATTAYCSADGAGHPACCRSGAACTGTINPITQNSGPNTASASTTGTSTASTVPFISGTATTTGGPFIQVTNSASSLTRSTVPNQFYPFPYIPTTYTNAAACSSAYTSCQSDAQSCSAALGSGQQGVTISAPNGGVTVTAIASLGPASASSICSSLSQAACSGLQVEACRAFGGTGPAATRCADVYRVGVGMALGIAGQLMR